MTLEDPWKGSLKISETPWLIPLNFDIKNLFVKINNLPLIYLGYKGFVVQLLSLVWLFVTPWTAARQVSLSFTISWSLLESDLAHTNAPLLQS